MHDARAHLRFGALRQHGPAQWSLQVAADLMTADPITVGGDFLAIDALECMERNHRKPMAMLQVVSAGGRMLGLLRLHVLVQAGLGSR